MADPQRSTATAPAAPAEPADQPVLDATLSYEQARDELLDVVRQLEAGGTSLEDSLSLWERGEMLARHCQTWLDGARQRLDDARNASTQP